MTISVNVHIVLSSDGRGAALFLYHHPTQPGAPLLCDFGVEVARRLESGCPPIIFTRTG
jgi:hypothetical protein